MRSFALIVVFTLLCGTGDALGFVHASRCWQDGRFVWAEALKATAAFQFGVVMYLLALRELSAHGVVATETQTLVWFLATIVGVAALSGQALRWHPIDQLVAALVLVGVGWLLLRTGS